MTKLYRLKEILEYYKKIFLTVMNEDEFNYFKEKVMKEYKDLNKKRDLDTYNMYHMNWAEPVVAFFKVLKYHFNISTNKAIEIIHQVTYKSSTKIFEDLSFVQMAYYLMCNRPYLKQIILNSLAFFESTDIEDQFDEVKTDPILNIDLCDSNIEMFFDNLGVSELEPILIKTDEIIDDFIESQFSDKKLKVSVEELF